METTKNKIVKIAKICKHVAKALCLISGLAFFVFLVLSFVFPFTGAIDSITKTEAAVVFSVLTLYSLLFFCLFWAVAKLFQAMQKEKTPFPERVCSYLKRTALCTLLLSFVPAVVGSVCIRALAENSNFVFRIEPVGIATGIIFYLLGIFFPYGNALQKRDDETL